MRYHWGLGVGHLHAHQPTATTRHAPEDDTQSPEYETEEPLDKTNVNTQTQDENSDIYNSDDPELDLEDRDLEGWEDVELEDLDCEIQDEDMEGDFTGM